MQKRIEQLLWPLLLMLILLVSAGCSQESSSSQQALPAPQEEATEVVNEEVEGSNREEVPQQQESPNEEEASDGQKVQGFLTVSNQIGAKIFQFNLSLPESWKGIFEMQQPNEEAVSFLYTGNPDSKKEVFTIEAMSETAWKEKQNEEDAGVGIISDRGIIFIYRVTKENPYEGEESDTFQSMISNVPEIITTFKMKSAE